MWNNNCIYDWLNFANNRACNLCKVWLIITTIQIQSDLSFSNPTNDFVVLKWNELSLPGCPILSCTYLTLFSFSYYVLRSTWITLADMFDFCRQFILPLAHRATVDHTARNETLYTLAELESVYLSSVLDFDNTLISFYYEMTSLVIIINLFQYNKIYFNHYHCQFVIIIITSSSS